MRGVTLVVVNSTENINPSDYLVSEETVRREMTLKPTDICIEVGVQGLPENIYLSIIGCNGINDMKVRLRPDFIITREGNWYLVEVKTRFKYLEAMQLIFNQQSNLDVIYLFLPFENLKQSVEVFANEIEWGSVCVPEKKKDIFDKYFKNFMKCYVPNFSFKYLKYCGGSGDPFIEFDITKQM